MKKENLIILLLLLFSVVSCHRYYTQNELILRAERYMDTRPDSSFLILNAIKQPEKLSNADYAAWCLQMSRAKYKLDIPVTSDSLLKVALNYYDNSNLYKYSGLTYYLLGYISENNNKDLSIQYYKSAIDKLQNTTEYNQIGLTYFNLAFLFYFNEMHNQSLEYLKKSLRFFEKTNNQYYLAYAYSLLYENYAQLQYPTDTVLYYNEKSTICAKAAKDTVRYYQNICRRGELIYEKDYKGAKYYLLQSFKYDGSEKGRIAAFLSSIYLSLNNVDSANYYIQIAEKDTARNEQYLLKNITRAYISEKAGNYKEAFRELETSYNFRDKMYKEATKNQLYKIDKQYDLSHKEKENDELKISNRNKMILIAILVIVVLFAVVIILLIISWNKKRRAAFELEKQRLEYEINLKRLENDQKRNILITKLHSWIENTLKFNDLKNKLSQKKDNFLVEISKQSMVAEDEWQFYMDEINQIFENKIGSLPDIYPKLTKPDIIIISLVCLGLDIVDCCNLLNMSKNTIYHRRKIIKDRLQVNDQLDLDEWIKINIVDKVDA